MRMFLVAAALAVLSGCASTSGGVSPTGEVILREVAALAVSRYVRETPDIAVKAVKIRRVLAEIQETEDVTTAAKLRQALKDRIAQVEDPFDRSDYTHLLNILSPLLDQYVGSDGLAPNAVVKVKDFVSYIASALPVL